MDSLFLLNISLSKLSKLSAKWLLETGNNTQAPNYLDARLLTILELKLVITSIWSASPRKVVLLLLLLLTVGIDLIIRRKKQEGVDDSASCIPLS